MHVDPQERGTRGARLGLCRCSASPPRAGAGPGVARARGTRPPGSNACTCLCPSVRRKTPGQTPRRGGRCVGGGRPHARGRGGRATGHPIVGGEGASEPPQTGADAAPVVSVERIRPVCPPCIIRDNPQVVEGRYDIIQLRAGVPLGGCHMGVMAGERAHQHPSAAPRFRRSSKMLSGTAFQPILSPSWPSCYWRSAVVGSVGSMRTRRPGRSPSEDRASSYVSPPFLQLAAVSLMSPSSGENHQMVAALRPHARISGDPEYVGGV